MHRKPSRGDPDGLLEEVEVLPRSVSGPGSVRKWLPHCALQLSAHRRHFVHRCQSSQVAGWEEQSKKEVQLDAELASKFK